MMPPRADAPKVGKMKPVEPPKVAKMRGFDAALDYYLGPTGIPDRLRALNSMLNPVETLGGSMRASQRMLAPDTAPMGRVQAAGDMLSGVAGFAAPMVAASKLGVPAASAVADAFTGLSTGAQKAGATVVDRLNQPGPMPTLYSNPIPGLMGPKKGIRAYHGSPHSFDKFSMDKIGTGEGEQAYGHGLYFAENEGVAKQYRDALSGPLKFDGRQVADGEGYAYSAIQDAGGSIEQAIADTLDMLKDNSLGVLTPQPKNGYVKGLSVLQKWQRDGVPKVTSPGSMYEVQINADPADFLDWDKPLSAQPGKVAKYFGGAADSGLSDKIDAALRKYNETGSPDDMIEYNRLVRGADYSQTPAGPAFAAKLNTPEQIAAMREAGIPGIKYLDAGSRGAGDGSRNYVVFDDKLIEILRKYGLAGVAVGAAGMSQPKPAKAGIAMGK
jgi:hypothetical protein